VRIKLNSVFQNVNKTQVSTQFLAEYAHPILPMKAFNGTLVDSIRTDMNLWRQLYTTTFTAYLGTATHPMPELNTVNTTIASVQNAIPISLLHWNYNDMRPDAVTANLLSITNNQLFDVAGRSQSPYQAKTLFAAAPAVSSSNNATITFVLRSDLFIKNTGTINATYIDLADGLGYRVVTLGTPFSVSYPSTGIRRIKVKVVPAAGAVMESWFDFQANTASCASCLYSANNAVTLNDANFLPNANHAGGTIQVIYSTRNTTPIGNRRVQRPLIIAEGFDAFSVAPLLVQENWDLRRLVNLINAPTTFNFNFALDNTAGYDLVFIDYNNGTDDIRRNAVLLQAVIRRVNAEKAAAGSNLQNVVMGLSMGGLVARYGLAQMVRNGENPQTRLLITHDSPHRGANVPLGAQFLGVGLTNSTIQILGYNIEIGSIFPPLQQIQALFNAQATTQLLALRATGPNTTATNTFLAPGGIYRTMVDNVPSQPYQVIATSDGSQCGNQLFAPGTNLVQADAGFFIAPLTQWIASSGFRTSLTINAAQNQQQNQVLNFRAYTQFKIFTIPINVTLSSTTGNSPATALALDGAPGGTYPKAWLPEIPTVNKKFNIWLFGFDYGLSITPEFCFVPTASALDVTNFNASALTEKYTNSVNIINPSKFTRFIAQESFTKTAPAGTFFNQEHITLTPRNSRWIYEQMENITPSTNQECTTECTSSGVIAITGNSSFCASAPYSVNTPTGTPVTWTVTPSGIASLSANGNTATLTRIVGGTITLTARVGACIVLTKTVEVGAAPPDFNIAEVQKPCPPTTDYGNYFVNPITPNVTYTWQCSGCNGAVNVVGSQGESGAISVLNNGNFILDVTATYNTCSSSTKTISTTFSTGTNCNVLRVALSPNPVQTQLSVDIEDDDDVQGKKSYQVTIADYLGNVKFDGKFSSPNAKVDVSNLTPGTYSMRIIKGSKITTKTFTVAR
jgi:hypothetical protein